MELKLFGLCLLIAAGTKAIKKCAKDRYYPRYHLAPPCGWMNDPNGFSLFRNEYHMFYQYNPESSLQAGTAHWGHAKSNDLFHWEHLPVAFYPDAEYDKNGVFSGSALIENDTMYVFYTGNVDHPNEVIYHTERQALAVSTDGVSFTKYEKNPVIIADDRQPNIRDPKVWKHDTVYYMVLGNSYDNDTLGRILLYKSDNKLKWDEVSVLGESNGTLGYMWECPNFFQLNGKFVLLFSPQGVKPQGDKFNNLYQTGYFVGDFNYDTFEFKPLTEFIELDSGHDFYAPQITEDDKGRILLVTWFDMWEQDYPEGDDGFTGQLTLIRQLNLTDNYKLIQKPIEEVKQIRGRQLHRGRTDGGGVLLKDKAGEISIKANRSRNLEVIIESVDDSARVTISYDASNGLVTLDRGGEDGVRRTQWKPSGKYLKWRIFVDASSVELFCGRGEITFSSRFFPKDDIKIQLGNQTEVRQISVTELKRTVFL